MSRHLFSAALLTVALATSLAVRAEEVAAPAPAAPAAAVPTATAPAPMMGMGMGMGKPMRAGMMGQKPCNMRGMAGGPPPCMTGKCQTAEALEHRVEALEKRLDAMQLTLELLVRQQKPAN